MKNNLKILACVFTCLASSAHASDLKNTAEEAQAKHAALTPVPFNPLSLNGALAYSTAGAVCIGLTENAKNLNPSHVNEDEREHIKTTAFAVTIDQNKQSGSAAFLALLPNNFPVEVVDLVGEYHFPIEISQKMYAEQEAELLKRTKAHRGEIQGLLSVGSFDAFARLPKSVAHYYELPNNHRVTLKNSEKGWYVSSQSPDRSYEEDFATSDSENTNLLIHMEGQICFNNRVLLAKPDEGLSLYHVTPLNIENITDYSMPYVSNIQFCSAFANNGTLPVTTKGRCGFYERELKQDISRLSVSRDDIPISKEMVLGIPGHRFEPLDKQIRVYKGPGKTSHIFNISNEYLFSTIPLFVEDSPGNSYFIYATPKRYAIQKDTSEYMLYNFQVFQAQWK